MPTSAEKIKTREYIAEVLKKITLENKVSGFTSGAFDILHAGHVDYLEKARAQCDYLVVAVNSDKSIRKYLKKKKQ